MLFDSLLLLMDGQDLSQTAGAYYSDKVINTSTVIGDIGAGEMLALIIVVDEAFVSDSTSTVKFSLIDEANDNLDGSSVEIVSTDALAHTLLTLGKIIILPVPAGLITQKYLGVRVDIANDTTSAGTVTAFIGPASFAQTWNV